MVRRRAARLRRLPRPRPVWRRLAHARRAPSALAARRAPSALAVCPCRLPLPPALVARRMHCISCHWASMAFRPPGRPAPPPTGNVAYRPMHSMHTRGRKTRAHRRSASAAGPWGAMSDPWAAAWPVASHGLHTPGARVRPSAPSTSAEQAPGPRNLAQMASRRPHGACKRRAVHANQAKALRVALRPLKVVQQTPVDVPKDRHAGV